MHRIIVSTAIMAMMVGVPSIAAAAPCKDAKTGKFIKCADKAPAKPVRCKDAKGKFVKCSTLDAKPA